MIVLVTCGSPHRQTSVRGHRGGSRGWGAQQRRGVGVPCTPHSRCTLPSSAGPLRSDNEQTRGVFLAGGLRKPRKLALVLKESCHAKSSGNSEVKEAQAYGDEPCGLPNVILPAHTYGSFFAGKGPCMQSSRRGMNPGIPLARC